jgi:hypothetical protein
VLAKLNAHLKGSKHSRKEQLTRGFNMDKKANGGKAGCPLCPPALKSFTNAKRFLEHINNMHHEELWSELDPTEVSSTEDE